jgi:large subunit ribosomal protein L30e
LNKRELGLILSKAVKTGKCVLGFREVQKSVRGSKIIIYSNNLSKDRVKLLIDACRVANVPTLAYDGSSFELGSLCGKKFRISALAVKSAGDADLTSLLNGTLGPQAVQPSYA